jgi:hypothetical protein
LCRISHKGREERKEGKAVSDQQYSKPEVITVAVTDITTVAVALV